MAFGMDYEKILRRHVLEEELRGGKPSAAALASVDGLLPDELERLREEKEEVARAAAERKAAEEAMRAEEQLAAEAAALQQQRSQQGGRLTVDFEASMLEVYNEKARRRRHNLLSPPRPARTPSG